MIKKISCLCVAVLTVVIMSVSAFAVVSNSHGDTIDLTHVLHKKATNEIYPAHDIFRKFITALNTNDFTNIIVTIPQCSGDGTVPLNIYVLDNSTSFVRRAGFKSTTGCPKFIHNFFVKNSVTCASFWNREDISSGSGVAVTGEYILSRYSDTVLVESALNAPIDDNYNQCNGDCDFIDNGVYTFKFSDSLLSELNIDYKPLKPEVPTEPTTPNPPPIDIDFDYVPYDTSVWVTFVARIKGYLAVIIPICFKIFAIILGLSLIVAIVRRFAKG